MCVTNRRRTGRVLPRASPDFVFSEGNRAMTHAFTTSKSMTIGEASLFPLFAVLSFLCLVATAFAHDGPFAFHALLGCLASLAASFFIVKRYYDRPAELSPQ